MIKRSFLTRQLPKIVSILILGLMGTIELSIIQAVPAEARPSSRPGRTPKTTTIRPRRKPVRFRVGVKPAPYRVSAISRSDQCDVGRGAQVVAPPEKMSDRTQPSKDGFLEQTTSDKPTFFIYLPQSTTSGAKLTVQNKEREQLDRVTFDLDAKSGIVAIPMSSQGKSLEVGQKYLWQMTIYCDSSAQMASVTLSGWVERVAIATPPQDLQERVSFYAENGIWQDAMGSLVKSRQQGQTDWAKDWTELMSTAELSQFKNADLVQVVTAG
jgi:hypothetical protein